jgi:U3 small nucleolar RNA-associated protein 4
MQNSGRLHLKRIRDFASVITEHVPKSSSSSTGSLAFKFTPDSSKLVLSTTTACVLVVDLSGEKPRVLRRFDHHRLPQLVIQERVMKGRKGDSDGDVDMTDAPVDLEEEGENQLSAPIIVNILRISISPDGQWLASSDDHSRTHVFNLDSIQVCPFIDI